MTACSIAMSLDAFVAGPNQRFEKPFGDIPEDYLHCWMFDEPEKHQAELNALADAGAFIMGSNMFDLRAQAFASDSLSYIGFAGSTGGPLFGLSSLVGMFILTMLSALGMGALGELVRGRDVETGMVLAFTLGVLFTRSVCLWKKRDGNCQCTFWFHLVWRLSGRGVTCLQASISLPWRRLSTLFRYWSVAGKHPFIV